MWQLCQLDCSWLNQEMAHLSVSHRADAQHQDTLPPVLCVVYERNSKWPTDKGSVISEGTAEMCDKQTAKAEASFPPPPATLVVVVLRWPDGLIMAAWTCFTNDVGLTPNCTTKSAILRAIVGQVVTWQQAAKAKNVSSGIGLFFLWPRR